VKWGCVDLIGAEVKADGGNGDGNGQLWARQRYFGGIFGIFLCIWLWGGGNGVRGGGWGGDELP